MKERILKLFNRKKKKKTYIAKATDWTAIAYWVLVLLLCGYFIIRLVSTEQIAASFLISIPALIGLLIGILLILFFLPVKLLNFLLTEMVLRVHLFHVPKNIPAETVVVIGKNEYSKPSFWVAPNYDMELVLILDYLRMKGKPFSVYYESSVETLDEIMADEKIRTVFLVGHGRRHGFVIDKNTVVDYCRYDDPKYGKDFVYQIHCNQGKGKSLVEYVVPKENWKECIPEHGYMSSLTIAQMFTDKIIELKQLTGFREKLTRLQYTALTMIIPVIVLVCWGYIFSSMVV